MIAFFRKKSFIWVIVGIAAIVIAGVFVIRSGKNTVDNTSKVSVNATTSILPQATTPPQQAKPTQQPSEKPTPPKATATVQPSSSTASQKYISNNLGFSITFPASWENKYSVTEDSNGLTVYFKPVSHPVAGAGMLFKIVKKTPDLNEGMLDTINGAKRYFTAKGTTFVIGGPTDVNFPENNPEFNTFRQLSGECSSVINTIQNIN